MSKFDSKIPTASGVMMVPIVQSHAIFADVVGVAPPNEYISPELWGIFQAANSLTIRQHVKVLPKTCCSCPPCVKQENTYSIYAGLSQAAEAEFLRVDEVSDDWNRCCCAPYHPLRLEVRQYIPVPGDSSASDFSHLSSDVRRDMQGLTGRKKCDYLRDMYKQQPVIMSMVRDDGQRCCWKCPCKWLDTFVCFNFCRDGMHLYGGALQDRPDGKEVGRPFELPADRLLGSAVQPNFGGCCIPTLHLRGEGQSDDVDPFGKIEGPYCFGGWSEMCCDFKFYTSWFGSPTKTGDVATIIKKKPSSLVGGLVELTTNADVYSIAFDEGAKLTAAQKATVLTGQLLADYMWFDGNTEKCSSDDNAVYCYCFYCSVLGRLFPCYIAIPKNNEPS